jgi:hypothetical protein
MNNSHCQHCFRSVPPSALARVQVHSRGNREDRRTLALCSRCATLPTSTWRLQYRQATDEEATA